MGVSLALGAQAWCAVYTTCLARHQQRCTRHMFPPAACADTWLRVDCYIRDSREHGVRGGRLLTRHTRSTVCAARHVCNDPAYQNAVLCHGVALRCQVVQRDLVPPAVLVLSLAHSVSHNRPRQV